MVKSGDRLGEGKGGIVYIEDIICRRLGAELRAGCCKLEVEMGRSRGNKRELEDIEFTNYVGRELRMKSNFNNVYKA